MLSLLAYLDSASSIDSLNKNEKEKGKERTKWSDVEWCCWLAESTIKWTALQHRLIILSAFLEALVSTPRSQSSNSNQTVIRESTLLAILTLIFTSKTSLLGIEIRETLSQLLLFLTQHCSQPNGDKSLLPAVVKCISSLTINIYYEEEVNDITQDLIQHLRAFSLLSDSNVQTNYEPTRVAITTNVILCMISVLEQAHLQSEMNRTLQIVDSETSPPVVITQDNGRKSKSFLKILTWQESLFLLNDDSSSVRLTYAHALLTYIRLELSHMTISSSSNGEHLLHFFDMLNVVVYNLALGKQLKARAASMTSTQVSSPVPTRSHPGSLHQTYLDSNEITKRLLPTPQDFAASIEILSSIQRTKLPQAALSTAPMLFSLDRSSRAVWGEAKDYSREAACKEVVIAVLNTIAKEWEISRLSAYLREVRLSNMLWPFLMIIQVFVNRFIATVPPLAAIDQIHTVFDFNSQSNKEAVTASVDQAALAHQFAGTTLESASSLDAETLVGMMQANWTPENTHHQRKYAGSPP